MIRQVVSVFLICILLFSCASVYAQEGLRLEPLIEVALKNNPEILAAKKRWEASLARVPQAKSLDNPSIGFSFEKMPGGTLKLDKTMSSDRMLNISQMFPWFGKLALKGKIAIVESQMMAADYKDKELEVISMLKKEYYELFMNYKEDELSRAGLAMLQDISRIAEARYAVGEIPQEMVFKLNLEIARLDNRIQNLKEERSASGTRVNTILNFSPEAPLGVPEPRQDLYFKADIEELYRLALGNQPALAVFSYAIERNRQAKALAKRSIFPDVMAQIGLRGFTGGGIGPWDLMLAFSAPLWFWTKQRYEIKEAVINLEEAEAVYAAMRNKAMSETKELFSRVNIAANKVRLYRDNLIPVLESSISSSLAAFRSGDGDLMMIIDNERMLIDLKMDHYKSIVEYNMSLADLERATGVRLTEAKDEKE
ncbi:MAG: TolC family protein [Candidatus Omnitrophica bacterium]|nr:TolC family protein [Candidatus Omnitrophota bacterium]